MIIAIAGNIASGKTTLATLLGKELGFETEFEQEENPYISDFYADMQRWSFNLQVHFLNNRLRQAVNLQSSGRNVIQDRTIYEDAEIFSSNLLGMGMMEKRDYLTYKSLFDTVSKLIPPPDLIIYLKASVPTLVEQIAKRGRDYEDAIRLDYLRRLNERYDEWYKAYSLGKKLEVCVDEINFKENPEHLGIVLNKVSAELYGLFR